MDTEAGCPHLEAHMHGDEGQGGANSAVKRDTRRLLIAITLCFVFMVAEIVGGWLSGSLAIMTDAAHLLSDVAGFLISLLALTWSTRPANTRLSFGYHRAEILGALLSIALVWILTAFLVVEAVHRVRNPEPIDAKVMLAVAVIGLIVNIFIAYTLHDHHHDHGDSNNHATNKHNRENLNIRAALIHTIGDIIQSAGVLIAAVVIWVRPHWSIADPLCTFLFSILVFGSTVMVTRDAVHILMEGSPREIDLVRLQADLGKLPGVAGVHDLHVWSLAAGKAALTVHVLRSEDAEPEQVLMACQSMLCRQYNIHHATVQIESRMDVRFHCHSHVPGEGALEKSSRLPW